MLEPGPIEAYLRALDGALRLAPARRRRVLEEVAGHLDDATRRAMEWDGLDRPEAERTAVERFGAPATIAASFRLRPQDHAALAAAAARALLRRRDALAALLVLACLLNGAVQTSPIVLLAIQARVQSWLPLIALLAPTAALTVASPLLVVRRRPLGACLAPALLACVAATAAAALLDLGPVHAFFAAFSRVALAQGAYVPSGTPAAAAHRSLAQVADDTREHAALIALAVTVAYAWVVAAPRRAGAGARTSRVRERAWRLALLVGLAAPVGQTLAFLSGAIRLYPPDLAGPAPALLVALAGAYAGALVRGGASEPVEPSAAS